MQNKAPRNDTRAHTDVKLYVWKKYTFVKGIPSILMNTAVHHKQILQESTWKNSDLIQLPLFSTACPGGSNYRSGLNTTLSHSRQMQVLMKLWIAVLNSDLHSLQGRKVSSCITRWLSRPKKKFFLPVKLWLCDVQIKFTLIMTSLPIRRKMQEGKNLFFFPVRMVRKTKLNTNL